MESALVDPQRRSTAVIVLWLVVLFSAPSSAQPSREAAGKLFEQGNQLFAAHDYDAALEKYLAARALFPSYKIDFNVATTLNALRRFGEAASYYERFLELGETTAPRRMSRLARSRFDELKQKLGGAKVTCAVSGAEVLIDDRTIGQTPLELGVYLAPGRHQLTVQKAGYARYQQDLELRAGERQEVTVVLELTGAPESSVGAAPGEELLRAAAPIPPRRDAPLLVKHETTSAQLEKRRAKTRWGYVALGGSLALAATAVVLYGIGGTQGKTAYDKYRLATDPQEIARQRHLIQSAQKKLTAGHVFLGVALVAGAVSLYEFLTRPALERSGPRSLVGFVPSEGGGSVQLSTSF